MGTIGEGERSLGVMSTMSMEDSSHLQYSSGDIYGRKRKGNRSSLGTLDRSNGNGYADGTEHADTSESLHSGDIGSKMESVTPSLSIKGVETYPDSENDYHTVIRNQNWDLLEILLKEYDFKKFKFKETKKPPRKLRVAKYLPDIPWKKEEEVVTSPLHGLDALGRAPLHLACISPCPEKTLSRLLFCARDVASVPDMTGSLPLHLAITHDHHADVLDKLIRAYPHGVTQLDSSGRTPFMWAIELVRRQKDMEHEKLPIHHPYWAYPRSREASVWQHKQVPLWRLVRFLLDNRKSRRQKLSPVECRTVTSVLAMAATPHVVSLFLELTQSAMKNEQVAGPTLSMCIARQYPVELLEKLIESFPADFAKEFHDSTGRGVVSMHYRIGCVFHEEDASDHNSKRESFRMIMQNLANAAGNLQAQVTPGKAYQLWWEKLKFLINLWGTYALGDDDATYHDFETDDLLLHNALVNPDVPPSLIRLLATLRPHATDFEHPKSSALPIHLACRVWRYKPYPPRKGEKESHVDKVVLQLLDGDFSRTRMRYRDRLPIHHAIAAGHQWMFIKPLVVYDRKSLAVRDPTSMLYPFQLAASSQTSFDHEQLTRRSFTAAEWKKMSPSKREGHVLATTRHYSLGQLTLIFEILRHNPEAVSHDSIMEAAAVRNVAKPRRTILARGIGASDQVAVTAHTRAVRSTFGLGPISTHFISWAYENTRRGWKTHRCNFGVLKEAIMDGFIASSMDEWWRKLKVLIWSDCPWNSSTIPHRDEFLLHGALCNPDTSPWIVKLIVECFPRSASIPLPGSGGCYPLHMACVTDKYLPLPFEFANEKSAIAIILKAYPDAAMLKWRGRIPLHLAISNSKDWLEIEYMAKEEPVALGVPDPVQGLYPYQLMTADRCITPEQRKRFEKLAEKKVGIKEWNSLSVYDKVDTMRVILEEYETNTFAGVWSLLRLNPTVCSVAMNDVGPGPHPSIDGASWTEGIKSCRLPYNMKIYLQTLSKASVEFLEVFYLEKEKNALEKNIRMSSRSLLLFDDSSFEPFHGNSSHRPRFRQQLLKPKMGGSVGSSIRSDASLGDPFAETTAIRPSPAATKVPDPDPTSEGDSSLLKSITEESDAKSLPVELSDYKAVLETSSLTLPSLEESQEIDTVSFDHPDLYHPRRKDILLVHNSSAHVVGRTMVCPGAAVGADSQKGCWIDVLKEIGEEVTFNDIHTIRHEKEQVVVSSAVIQGMVVLIDEDDTYVWIVCGKDSCSAIENYDVDTAINATSSFLDGNTGIWFEELVRPRHVEFSDEKDNRRILSWLLSMVENSIQPSTRRQFMISHSILRASLAPGSIDHSLQIDQSTRKLSFHIAKVKMEGMFPQRKFIGVRWFMARRACFQRQRLKFNKQAKAIRFMKRLKKKQLLADKRSVANDGTTANGVSSQDKISTSKSRRGESQVAASRKTEENSMVQERMSVAGTTEPKTSQVPDRRPPRGTGVVEALLNDELATMERPALPPRQRSMLEKRTISRSKVTEEDGSMNMGELYLAKSVVQNQARRGESQVDASRKTEENSMVQERMSVAGTTGPKTSQFPDRRPPRGTGVVEASLNDELVTKERPAPPPRQRSILKKRSRSRSKVMEEDGSMNMGELYVAKSVVRNPAPMEAAFVRTNSLQRLNSIKPSTKRSDTDETGNEHEVRLTGSEDAPSDSQRSRRKNFQRTAAAFPSTNDTRNFGNKDNASTEVDDASLNLSELFLQPSRLPAKQMHKVA